jgi:hypothetical protein
VSVLLVEETVVSREKPLTCRKVALNTITLTLTVVNPMADYMTSTYTGENENRLQVCIIIPVTPMMGSAKQSNPDTWSENCK